MTVQVTKPDKKSQIGTARLVSVWQFTPPDREAAPEKHVVKERQRPVPEPAKPKSTEPKATLEGDSRCSRMHDKLGCNCAVQNGGGISTDGRSWYSKRGGKSAPTNEAFVQCQIRAGRG
jgi:hypothetical protein